MEPKRHGSITTRTFWHPRVERPTGKLGSIVEHDRLGQTDRRVQPIEHARDPEAWE